MGLSALLIGTLSPPITAIAAMMVLEEDLTIISWVGMLLTILGVAWVITERNLESLLRDNRSHAPIEVRNKCLDLSRIYIAEKVSWRAIAGVILAIRIIIFTACTLNLNFP